AIVERARQRRDQRRGDGDGVERLVRVGHVALDAGNSDAPTEGAAPADLDGVADLRRGARLAYNGEIEVVALSRCPLQQLGRAIDALMLLVIGDGDGDTAGAGSARDGGDEGRNARFHIHRAPAIERVTDNLG